MNKFLKSWVNIFGPDLLYSLSHGSHDSRTFDFFDVSVSETRWLVISDFFDVFLTDLWTPNHMDPWFRCNGYRKNHDFPNMAWLWSTLTFFLERVEKKNAPSLRISDSRSFDWRYFQPHRMAPSFLKLLLLFGNFGNFRISRCVHPYPIFGVVRQTGGR